VLRGAGYSDVSAGISGFSVSGSEFVDSLVAGCVVSSGFGFAVVSSVGEGGDLVGSDGSAFWMISADSSGGIVSFADDNVDGRRIEPTD